MQIEKRIRMKLIAQITLASILGLTLVGCGASGTKADLVDNFSDDFETFKKQVVECGKVTKMGGFFGGSSYYHKELVQSYLDDIDKWKEKAERTTANSTRESLKQKYDSIIEKMEKYKLSDEEKKNYSNTCGNLYGSFYKYLQNQQEYDIFKQCSPLALDGTFGGAKYQECRNLGKELNNRAKNNKNSK